MTQAVVENDQSVEALLEAAGFELDQELGNTLPNTNTIDIPRVRVEIRDSGKHQLYVDFGENYLDGENRIEYLPDNKLEGVILHSQMIRALWNKGETIPACSSIDGKTRSETAMSKSCIKCAEAQIGVGKCKPKVRLLLLTFMNGKIRPLLLNLPPTSIKHFEIHKRKLLRSKLPLVAVNTVFSLEGVQKNNYKWAEIHMSMNGFTSKEMLLAAKEARNEVLKLTEKIDTGDFNEKGDRLPF